MNRFKAVCATQLGALGMQLWGVAAEDGRLFSIRRRPNGPWDEKWSAESKAPRNLFSLTAAQDRKGLTSLWALDNGVLVSRLWETGKDEWVTNPTPVKFALICVCEPSNKVGRQLWGVDSNNKGLYYACEEESGVWRWVQWKSAEWEGFQKATALTAAQDWEGWTSVWALDNGVLLSRALRQQEKGVGYMPYYEWVTNPTPANVKLARICGCNQGGALTLWGVGEKGELWWNYQNDYKEGKWTGWKPFRGPEDTVNSLAAARRQDGRVLLWAISNSNSSL